MLGEPRGSLSLVMVYWKVHRSLCGDQILTAAKERLFSSVLVAIMPANWRPTYHTPLKAKSVGEIYPLRSWSTRLQHVVKCLFFSERICPTSVRYDRTESPLKPVYLHRCSSATSSLFFLYRQLPCLPAARVADHNAAILVNFSQLTSRFP